MPPFRINWVTIQRYRAFAAGADPPQLPCEKTTSVFEFVGDSILNYTVAKMLFDAFPKLTEGELSRFARELGQ